MYRVIPFSLSITSSLILYLLTITEKKYIGRNFLHRYVITMHARTHIINLIELSTTYGHLLLADSHWVIGFTHIGQFGH